MSADDPSIGVDDTTLVEDDREYIMAELKNVLARHREIGSRLHLKSVTLDVIGRENPGAAQAMEAVIVEWLNKNYNTAKFGLPTWKALVAVVANPLGGNNKAEAERIAGRHKAATLGSTGTHRNRSPPSDPAGGNNRAKTEEIGSRHRATTEGSTGMKRRSLSNLRQTRPPPTVEDNPDEENEIKTPPIGSWNEVWKTIVLFCFLHKGKIGVAVIVGLLACGLYFYLPVPVQVVSSGSGSSLTEQPHATLTMADHNKVTQFLTDLTNEQLVDLGAALGLLHPHLQRMKTLPGDMVAAWLRMEDNVTQSPSWNTLAAALDVIHQRGIASTIRKAYNL